MGNEIFGLIVANNADHSFAVAPCCGSQAPVQFTTRHHSNIIHTDNQIPRLKAGLTCRASFVHMLDAQLVILTICQNAPGTLAATAEVDVYPMPFSVMFNIYP